MEEIWKPVPRYYGILEASNLGRIKRLANCYCHSKDVIIKGSITKNGYKRFKININQNPINEFFHIIIAETFYNANKYDKIVIHLDENRLNNTPENLKWSNRLESNHINKRKKIEQYDLNGNFIQEFIGLNATSRILNINKRSIMNNVNNPSRYKTIKGFIFKLKE